MAHISVKVKTEELKPGQILAEDVRDPHGRALLFQGVVLTSNLILGLRNRDYIDSVKILIPIEEAPDGLIKPEEGGIAIPGGVHQKIGRFFETARKVHELQPETIKNLTEDVKPVIEEIFETKPAIMDSLQLISSHDNHTHHHSWMVMLLTLSILRMAELKNILRPDRQDKLDMAMGGLLHDVGKAKIPLEILNKPGKLAPEEWKIMKKHPDYGYSMVKMTENLMPLPKAAVAHHHRFLDGTGYSPEGISPLERLPVLVRIITLADVYEAIVSDRPYHVAALPYHAIKIIGEEGGRKFDERFIDCLREMVAPFPTGSFLFFRHGVVGQVTGVDPLEKDWPFMQVIATFSKDMSHLVGREFRLGENMPGMPREEDIIFGAYSPVNLAEKIKSAMKIGKGLEAIIDPAAKPRLHCLPEWKNPMTEHFEFLFQPESQAH
jgi:HD-GYP domain-containing protein (c-di-GMP phosphodiesterase class II)